jgi:hypothetical protein
MVAKPHFAIIFMRDQRERGREEREKGRRRRQKGGQKQDWSEGDSCFNTRREGGSKSYLQKQIFPFCGQSARRRRIGKRKGWELRLPHLCSRDCRPRGGSRWGGKRRD